MGEIQADDLVNKNSNHIKFLVASSLGVFLEFLDFTLYGYIATIIAKVFLPTSNNSLDYVFLIFALGSISRLFGSLFFGYMGDTIGVKKVLTISILAMSLSTIGIGFLPGYATLGIWSPIMLIILRCLQGFAISPEYNGISVYLSRQKKVNRYSFFSSFSVGVAGLGMITGGYIMANMIGDYSIENVPEIRWRLPFILSGLLLGLTTFMLRLSMEEGVVQHKAQHATPLINVFRTQKKELLLTTLVVGLVATLTYSLNGFIPAYLQKIRGFSIKDALNLTSSYVYIMVVMIFISGFLCDYIQRKKIIIYTALATSLLAPLIFYYISYGDHGQIKNVLILFSCLLGFMSGGIPSFLASAFYDSQRYSGSTFAYNFGMACFGGFTPWIMFKLSTINDILPGIVISLFSCGVFFVIFFDKKIAYSVVHR